MHALLLSAVLLAAGDAPEVPAAIPYLFVGCHSGSPNWHRVRSELARDEWIHEAFTVVLIDCDFRDVRYRYGRGSWMKWPQPKECQTSAFATSGMAMIWMRPELESYIAGIAQDRFMAHWNLPIEVAPVEDDHVAPVPPSPDEPRGE